MSTEVLRPGSPDLHPAKLPHSPTLRVPQAARALLSVCAWDARTPAGVGAPLAIGSRCRVLSGSKGRWGPRQSAESPRPPSYSPFLGALHHQLVVTGHKLEFGGPLAHALQTLPHRGHGPCRPVALSPFAQTWSSRRSATADPTRRTRLQVPMASPVPSCAARPVCAGASEDGTRG